MKDKMNEKQGNKEKEQHKYTTMKEKYDRFQQQGGQWGPQLSQISLISSILGYLIGQLVFK